MATTSAATGCDATANQAPARQAATLPACQHPFSRNITISLFRCARLSYARAVKASRTQPMDDHEGSPQLALGFLIVRQRRVDNGR